MKKLLLPICAVLLLLTTLSACGGTVRPSPSPSPSLSPMINSFTASPSNIDAGSSSTLRWDVSKANSVSIDQGYGSVSLTGTKRVYPSKTTTYTIAATSAEGTVTATTIVTVRQPNVYIRVECNEFNQMSNISRQIEMGVGDLLSVVLCSNPSTGHSWSDCASISDQSVIQQVSYECGIQGDDGNKIVKAEGVNYVLPPGEPSAQSWVFRAIREGTSTIKLEYRSWAGGYVTKTFIVTAVVN